MHGRRKNYRAWDAQQCSQEPVAPRDALPEDDLVFFLLDLVPQIDLSPFHQYYAQELRGQPPFDVTMMVTLLVYAYSVGVCSSRRVAAACERNLAFRAVVGDDPPDFRTISDFRKIHLAAFRPLFLEVLRLAGEMGMVKLGNLSTDGTKMGANASRHKAMSYGYMNKEIQRLEAEIEQLLKRAEQLDAGFHPVSVHLFGISSGVGSSFRVRMMNRHRISSFADDGLRERRGLRGERRGLRGVRAGPGRGCRSHTNMAAGLLRHALCP